MQQYPIYCIKSHIKTILSAERKNNFAVICRCFRVDSLRNFIWTILCITLVHIHDRAIHCNPMLPRVSANQEKSNDFNVVTRVFGVIFREKRLQTLRADLVGARSIDENEGFSKYIHSLLNLRIPMFCIRYSCYHVPSIAVRCLLLSIVYSAITFYFFLEHIS